ncbi:MAG: hypothetical protein ACYSW2_16490 [Planctomycetota bacterium]
MREILAKEEKSGGQDPCAYPVDAGRRKVVLPEEKVMPLFSRRVQSLALAAFLTLAIGAPTADASIDLQLNWWIDGSVAGQFSIVGSDMGNGMFNYAGTFFYRNPSDLTETVKLTVNVDGKPDAGVGADTNVLISGNLAVENQFSGTIDVGLEVILPIAQPMPGSLMDGSATLGLTADDGGGTLASLPGTLAVWQGLADGSPVGPGASMFFHPFELEQVGFGSNFANGDFGMPDPFVGPAIANSIGIDINFSLTTLDQVSITSVLNVVPIPGPGGLVGLAAAGLVIRRRRR